MMNSITDQSKPLTAKMQRFVDAYLADPSSATKCAITAGYGEKSAHVTASRLLKLSKVQEAIRAGTGAILQRGAVLAAIKLVSLIDHKSGYVALEASKDALNRNGIGTNPDGAGQRSGLTVNIIIPDPNGGPHGPIVDVTPGAQNDESAP